MTGDDGAAAAVSSARRALQRASRDIVRSTRAEELRGIFRKAEKLMAEAAGLISRDDGGTGGEKGARKQRRESSPRRDDGGKSSKRLALGNGADQNLVDVAAKRAEALLTSHEQQLNTQAPTGSHGTHSVLTGCVQYTHAHIHSFHLPYPP